MWNTRWSSDRTHFGGSSIDVKIFSIFGVGEKGGIHVGVVIELILAKDSTVY